MTFEPAEAPKGTAALAAPSAASTAPPSSSETDHLYLDQDMTESAVGPFVGGVAAVFSARHPSQHSANEDAAALLRLDATRGCLAVADGFGGLPAGAQAACLALQALRDSVREAFRAGRETREGVLNGFEAANTAVRALGVGAATTLAVAEIHGRVLRAYHAGDSMICLVGQRGKIKFQTLSHSPVGYAVESGLLGEKEAMRHAQRHEVSNMVGSAGMRIDIGPSLPLAERDTVVLGSDGLFDNLRLEEIVKRVCRGALRPVMAALDAACRRRMEHASETHPSKPDDWTCLLFRPKAQRRDLRGGPRTRAPAAR